MAAAPVETCQSVVLRSPWGRLGSVLYTCNRLHRMRRRIQHFWSISPSSPRSFGMNYLTMASRALGEHQTAASMAYAAQATTRHQTYLERPPGADLHPKKVNNLGPMAPRSASEFDVRVFRPFAGFWRDPHQYRTFYNIMGRLLAGVCFLGTPETRPG